MRALYVCLIYLLTPFYLLGIWIKGLRRPDDRGRIPERLGHVTRPPQPISVWVHAVSVGETLAALPLIRALIQRHGPGRVWVTSGTPTGRERVRAALGDQALHSYAPLDLVHVVRRFVARVRPQKVVVIETEIWPSLYRQLHKAGVPILIVNARLSDRSFAGYRRFPRFVRSVLAQVRLVAAQSEADASRFRALGAPDAVCSGNLKFDAQPDAMQVEHGQALRRDLGSSRPVWIAASTHEGEEQAALAAHTRLLQQHPAALLILVPRHPQRFAAAAAEITVQGLSYARRSQGASAATTQVLLGDSMGEMWCYLAAADVAFVGGSLVPVGGHNVLEPAALGLPVLFGPHMHNFIAARDALLAARAAQTVADDAELAAAVSALFADPVRCGAMAVAARQVIGQNRGALQRVLQQIENL